MKRDRLLGKGLMRLAAYVVMAFACVGSASVWGLSTAPINPAFKQWQKERRQKPDSGQFITNNTSRSRRRLASGEGEGELGFAPGTFDSSYLSSINVNSQQGVQGGFASRYDLREHSILTTVKDQNPYGTCWAHATCASLESWLLKSGVGTFDFSENNMANLHGGDWGFNDGGNGDRASAYLLRWGGPVLESQDPYPNWGGSTEKAPSRHVQNVRWIPGRTSYLDNDAIKQAIIDFGATYVSYYHSSSYYKSSTASYYFYGNTSRNGNHAVAIVGWDDDYPASKFAKVPPGNGAFIVRNSWGAYWGEGGYFYVSYYDESFAWTTLYSFSNAEPTDNYDSIYEYDPLGLVSSLGYGSATAWGANMFQATSATKISAVGFYAMTPNTTYTVYVYTGSTASSPRSGTLATTQSGKSAYAGYVTMPLSAPVSVSARQRFSVVVQLTTPGYNYPLACEYAYPGYTSEATAASGQSFLSSNGSSWTDFTSWQGSANFCCKAYTKSAPPPATTLSSIAISGVTSLTSGQSAQFTCEATYSDGSKKAVSPTWSIARAGQAYATVSASGLVTAKEVSAQQTVTVQASYTEDGIAKDATWGMYVTIAAPSAPTGVTATQGTEPSCVRVNWTAPSGATEYAVYRATANNSKNAKYLENVTVPRYNDTSAVPGIDYWYFIKAKNSSGVSGFSAGANGWRKLSPPEDVKASDTLFDKVALEWNEVEGATHYRVCRTTSMDGAKTALGSGWQTATTFNDTTATAGVTYYYFVVAAVNASGSRSSDYSIVEDGMRAKTVTIDRLELKGDATINAGAHADYTADAIYSDGHKVANITPGSWEIVGEGASVVGGRVSAATVAENKTVVLKATYTEGGKTVRGEKQIAIAAVKPVAPRNVAVTAEAQGVMLTWSAVAGAASYAIYRDGVVVGRVIPNVPDAPATTYSDNTAVPGVTYAYCVAAANGAGEGPQSSPAVTAAIPLPAPAGVTATSDRTDGVLVDWRRVMDNAPYQSGTYYFRVSRATSATGTKTELGSWQTGTSYLDTSATAGTRYWYFVRAATSSGGANASDWSAGVVGRVAPNAPTLSSITISGPDKVSASKTAMYTCTATYSDGTSKSVSPTWSVSGAATIDANGKLTANAVSANSTATVVASFTDGTTKTANKAVTVIAPIRATAEVRNINVASRWPFSSLLDIDYELVTDPASAKAMVNVIGRDEDHNVDMAAKTLSGDGANGSYIAAGQHRLTWNIGADYTNFHAKAFGVTMTATPSIIGVPENVTVSASTSGVTLNWSAVEDATGYEVWRGTGTTTNGATRIATVTGATTYFDGTGTAGTTYRYWLRAFGEDGMGEFAQPVTGMRVLTVTISFNGNGGTASTSSRSYTAYGTYGSLPSATRTGYTFAGWWTESSGGTQVTTTSTVPAAATTLWAHWTANATDSHAKVQLWEDGPYWATTNIGAENPEDYGYYFWWGDTVGYKRENDAWVASDGSSSNFSFGSSNTPTYNKTVATLQSEGWITADGVLAPAHDAAHVHWGGDWRMPTDQELADLNYKCDWTWTTMNGVNGYVVKGKGVYASASIFLPCAGYGYDGTSLYYAGSYGDFWSSVPYSDSSNGAWGLYFNSSSHGTYNGSRYYGRSVRPVQGFTENVTIYFNGNGGTASTSSQSYTAYGTYNSLPTAMRSGYTFAGWWTESSGGTQVTTTSTVPAAATTLWAHWTANATDSHAKVQLWEDGPYWATTNIGAENPEDYGYYFWWGDTIGYKRENDAWVASDGSSSNFSFSSGNTPTYNKSIATLQSEGWITADSVLASAHDAAHVHWGGDWRMPTDQELADLNSKCDWTWTTMNGVNGYVVKGKGVYASASIFLPCAGRGIGTSLLTAGSDGRYWSSVPYSVSRNGWYLYFNSSRHDTNDFNRLDGRSVRPVQGFTE